MFYFLHWRSKWRLGNDRNAADNQNQHKNETNKCNAHFNPFFASIGNRLQPMLMSIKDTDFAAIF